MHLAIAGVFHVVSTAESLVNGSHLANHLVHLSGEVLDMLVDLRHSLFRLNLKAPFIFRYTRSSQGVPESSILVVLFTCQVP